MNQEFKWNFCSTIRSVSVTYESRMQMAFLQHNITYFLIKSVFRCLREVPVPRPATEQIQHYSKGIGCYLLECVEAGVWMWPLCSVP